MRAQIVAQPVAPPIVAGFFLFALGAWCVRHGYIGVDHDAILYAFQAIATDELAFLKDDLYLRYGSQDAYTAFSPIFRAFIAGFGLSGGSMAMVVVGQVAWIGGALALFRAITGASVGALSVAALMIAALDPVYGVGGALKFGEGFATPRLWAEATILLALAAFAARRWALAAALFAAALALHPILAAIGVGLAVLVLTIAAPRFLWLVPIGAVAALIGAALDLGPLGALFATFDPDWLAVARNRSPHLFVDAWTPAMLAGRASTLVLLLAGAVLAEGAFRRWMLAAAALFAIGLAASFVFTDLLSNVLITQVQPWRAALYARVFACFALASLLLVERGAFSPQVKIAAPAVLMTQVAVNAGLAMEAAGFFAAAALLAAAGAARRPTVAANFIAWLMAFGAFGIFVFGAFLEIAEFERLAAFLARSPEGLLTIPMEALLIPHIAILAAVFGLAFRARSAGYVFAAGGLAIAVIGAGLWDQRSDWRRYVDGANGALGDGAFATAPGEAILWQGGNSAPPVWFGLHRAAYLAWPQGAGVVFNRGTALEYARRAAVAEPVDNRATTQTVLTRWREAPEPTAGDLALLCADEAGPRLVVLTAPLSEREGRIWDAPAPDYRTHIVSDDKGARLTTYAVDRYHIYDCRDFGG
ncbi:MAG: hypothetical protein AAFN79_02090 [Pseudomonadota bacterium]